MILGPTMAEKTSMGRQKYNLTRGTGALKRCIAEQDRYGVKSLLVKLKVLFTLFEQTHNLYDHTLANEDDIDNSTEYFCAAERTFISKQYPMHTNSFHLSDTVRLTAAPV